MDLLLLPALRGGEEIETYTFSHPSYFDGRHTDRRGSSAKIDIISLLGRRRVLVPLFLFCYERACLLFRLDPDSQKDV